MGHQKMDEKTKESLLWGHRRSTACLPGKTVKGHALFSDIGLSELSGMDLCDSRLLSLW